MRYIRLIVDVAHRELRRIAGFRVYMLLIAVLPAVALLFFCAIFRGGRPNDLPIAVVDEDCSPLSRQLRTMIDAAAEVDISCSAENMLEAERLIREGRVHAVVLIPKGFEKNIMTLVPANVEAYISGSNILINGLTSKSLLTTMTTFSAGVQIQRLTSQGMSQCRAASMAMPVGFEQHTLFNPYVNYSYYLSPSFMPMMLLIFTMLAAIFALGSELRYATAAEWLSVAGDSVVVALVGKFMPLLVAIVVQALMMFLLQFEVIGVPLRGSFALLFVGCIVFLMSYIAIAITLVAVTADMRLALSLGGGYAVMAFSFSGLTFPLMAMHHGLQLFSRIFPFSYFTDIVVDQAIRGAPPVYSLYNILYMMLFWILPLFVLQRLRYIAAHREFWGKI